KPLRMKEEKQGIVGTPICPSVGLEVPMNWLSAPKVKSRNADLPECGIGRPCPSMPSPATISRNADLPECGIGSIVSFGGSGLPRIVGTPICPSVGLEVYRRNSDHADHARSERRFARVWDWKSCARSDKAKRLLMSERRFARVWDWKRQKERHAKAAPLSRNADLPECGIGRKKSGSPGSPGRRRNADLPECGIGSYRRYGGRLYLHRRDADLPECGIGTRKMTSQYSNPIQGRNADLPECGIGTIIWSSSVMSETKVGTP